MMLAPSRRNTEESGKSRMWNKKDPCRGNGQGSEVWLQINLTLKDQQPDL